MTNMLLTDWIPAPEASYCYMRCINGTDINDIANRVAFIEKTTRIRVSPFTNLRDDSNNWKQGPKGTTEYGEYQPSRDWCDEKLKELGYIFK